MEKAFWLLSLCCPLLVCINSKFGIDHRTGGQYYCWLLIGPFDLTSFLWLFKHFIFVLQLILRGLADFPLKSGYSHESRKNRIPQRWQGESRLMESPLMRRQ
jgi:hypothetical protein